MLQQEDVDAVTAPCRHPHPHTPARGHTAPPCCSMGWCGAAGPCCCCVVGAGRGGQGGLHLHLDFHTLDLTLEAEAGCCVCLHMQRRMHAQALGIDEHMGQRMHKCRHKGRRG